MRVKRLINSDMSSGLGLNGLTGVFIVEWLRVILDHMVRVYLAALYTRMNR